MLRKEIIISLLSFLCNGITLAFFHKLGTLPEERDKLKSLVNGLTRELSAILVNLVDITSGAYDLLPFGILIWSRTSSETVMDS